MEVFGEMIKPKGEEEEDKRKPIVVILVGEPGSGKSTFCDHVMRVSTRPWVRVCQDIGNGNDGAKAHYLAFASFSLEDGKSILIDGCNLDKEQRADFMKLKESHQVAVHAVVFDLPENLCISRSVKRTRYEGMLQGGKASVVVNQTLQKKELPKLDEGFTRITFCQNEKDVQSAMNSYGALSSLDTLPFGIYGDKTTDNKDQLRIMNLLKADSPGKVTSTKRILEPTWNYDLLNCVIEKNKKFKGSVEHVEPEKSCYGKQNAMNIRNWASWAQSLYRIAKHPEKYSDEVIEIFDDVVVLLDAYPKAQKHVLVVSRVEGLDCLADAGPEHLPLLRKMHAIGVRWAETFLKENESLVFRLGYHSEPSMRQLHLHVISQDFDSKNLKKNKHWNAFNSPYSRDSLDVIQEISEHGKAKLYDDKEFLTMDLRCNQCGSAHPTLLSLKAHISICKSPFPANLLQNGRLVYAPNEKSDAPYNLQSTIR